MLKNTWFRLPLSRNAGEGITEPLIIFLAFVGLGIWSMAPSVTFGDAGEFTACAATLGLPHAPGYPLYVLMAKAMGTLVSLGNWGWRTNLFSVLCGAAALAVLASGLKKAGLRMAARLSAVLILGMASLWRYESQVTEVFALNNLAIAALVWLACRFAGRLWEQRPLAAAGLVLGLGFGNHQTIILTAPAFFAAEILEQRQWQKVARGLAVCAAFFALGMLVYLFLPLRTIKTPPLNWGHPDNLARFLHMLLRKDYGSFSLTVAGSQPRGPAAWLSQSLRYLKYTDSALGPATLSLAIIGTLLWNRALTPPLSRFAGEGIRIHNLNLIFPLLLIIIPGPFFLILGNPPFDAQTSGALERFYLASWFGVAILAAAGINAIASYEFKAAKTAAWILALLPAISGLRSAQAWLVRSDFAAYDYGRSVMKSLPPGSSLFMDGGDDTFYTLAFLRAAQRLRPDLDIHDRGGLVFPGAYGPDFLNLPALMKEERRIQIESVLANSSRLYYSTLNSHLLPGFTLEPAGLLYKADNKTDIPGTEISRALWAVYPMRWQMPLLQNNYRDRALVAFYPVMRAAQNSAQDNWPRALQDFHLAWMLGPDVLWLSSNLVYSLGVLAYQASQHSNWALTEQALSFAHSVAPSDTETLLNLGVVEERFGHMSQAEALYQQATALKPDSSRAYYNLGELYWKQSRWPEAATAFAQAQRLSPGDAALARFAAVAQARAARK